MRQKSITFKFNLEGVKDFFCVSEKNIFAYKLVSSWPKWVNKNIYIYGPLSSGKTLITEIWQKKTNAIKISKSFLSNLGFIKNQKLLIKNRCWIIDDLDKILFNEKNIEENILNFINILNENKNFLLITSKSPPLALNLKTKDLQSRLSAFVIAQLKEPDEGLLKKIIIKNFNRKQIKVSDNSIKYLLNHIERTYSSAWRICNKIDKRSLEEKKKITIPFLKKILSEINL